MSFQIIPKNSFKRSTWKNGLGFTDEIAIYPPGSELSKMNFLWRISTARIEGASVFSMFPQHDRLLVVLKGAGVNLIHEFEGQEESSVISPLEPYEFPGDISSRCELLDGPIVDLSIFMRKGEVDPFVEIIDIAEGQSYAWDTDGKWNYGLLLSGGLEAEVGFIPEGDAFSADAGSHSLNGVSDSKVLLFSLR